jgi:Transposase
VLCELARTDHHRFRVLEPDTDQTRAIRALTRAREDLVQARTGIVKLTAMIENPHDRGAVAAEAPSPERAPCSLVRAMRRESTLTPSGKAFG